MCRKWAAVLQANARERLRACEIGASRGIFTPHVGDETSGFQINGLTPLRNLLEIAIGIIFASHSPSANITSEGT